MNQTVSLNGDFTAQLADLQRRQKLAEMLQQQANEPIPVSSYNGIQAPISPLAGLAKVLQSYTAGKTLHDLPVKEAAVRQGERDDYAKQMAAALGATTAPGPAPPQPMPSAPPSQAAPSGPPVAAPGPPAQPSANPLVAALGGAGGPQNISNAPPMMQAQAPPAPVLPAGPQPTGGATPVPTAPVSPLDQAKAQYARAMQMLNSPNPMVAQAAPELVKQAQEQIKKQMDLEDVSRQKKADKADDITTATGLVKSLPGITDDQRAYLTSVAASGGMTALKPSLDKLAEVNFAPHVTQATPDDLKGYPAGTIGQKDPTGKLINVYNPSDDKNRAAQLQIERERLAIERTNSQRDSLVQPATIEYQVNGEPVQTTASFDKKSGNYIDLGTGKPIINPQGLRLLPTASGSSRSAMGIARTLTSAHDAVTGIENLSNLDNRADVGMFPNLATSPKSALTRTLSPQQVQSAQATMGGLGRALAGLASGGLAPDQNTLHSYEALTPSLGDTQLTKMRKLAEMRQQTENALDVQSVSPLLTPDQKKQVNDLKARVSKAIPWTVPDVQRLENASDPNVSLRSLGMNKTGTGPKAADGWGVPKVVQH